MMPSGPAPSMLLRHELRLLWRDPGAAGATIALGLCLLAGLLSGRQWQATQVARHDADLAATMQRGDSLTRTIRQAFADTGAAREKSSALRHPVAIGTNYLPLRASLPPAPLGALAVGQRDLFPTVVRLTPRSFQTLDVSTELVNPRNLLEGRFDPTHVVVALLPLFLIGLTFNVLSGERDRGTLGLLATMPVSPMRMLGIRLVARALPALVLLGLLGLALLADGGRDALAPLLWWGMGVLAYVAFWLGLALLVNSLGWTSAANAMALASVWLVVVLIAPAMLQASAQWRHPPPSRVALTGQQREASRAAYARAQEVMRRYLGDHPELAPGDPEAVMEDYMSRLYAVQNEVDRALQPTVAAFDSARVRQQRLGARWGVLSPAAVLHGISTDVAGSSMTRFQDFHDQLRRVHLAWQAHFIPPVFQRRELTLAEFESRPTWTPPPAMSDTVAGRMLARVAWLWCLALLLWVGAWRRLRTSLVSAAAGAPSP
jgi:ABC-2 type transport system permease protein